MERYERNDAGALPITVARARLFHLVEEVLTGRAGRVELSHRAFGEHVLLIRKGEVERLEADLQALRARVGPEPRPLRGMGRLKVEPQQVLARTRERQAALAAEKRAALRSPPTP